MGINKIRYKKFDYEILKKKAKERKQILVQNEKITKDFETMPLNEHAINVEVYKKAKQEIEDFHNEKIKGYVLRSKCQWYEEGEKSTKFFLGLEKKRAINGTIDTLIRDNNEEITDYKEVLTEIKNFYKNLF